MAEADYVHMTHLYSRAQAIVDDVLVDLTESVGEAWFEHREVAMPGMRRRFEVAPKCRRQNEGGWLRDEGPCQWKFTWSEFLIFILLSVVNLIVWAFAVEHIFWCSR